MSGDARTTLRLGTTDADLARAADLLQRGRLVALPTETVYGLAVRADDADAVARLFVAKERPADNPLIVHVGGIEDVLRVASVLPDEARLLLEALAPGPLTVVLPARDELPRSVTGGLSTVAVRVPDHPVARDLLRRTGLPLAAPSANRSTRPSPTRAEHVLEDLDGRIDAVVDAGPTRVGLESTVVAIAGGSWRILRTGGIDEARIAAVLGPPASAPGGTDDAARSPGTRHRHYAPSLPVHLAPAGAGPARAIELAERIRSEAQPGDAAPVEPAGLVGLVAVRPDGHLGDTPRHPGVEVLAVPVDAAALATQLFGLLRLSEQRHLAALVVEAVDPQGIGHAVMDRLARASAASGGEGLSPQR